MKRCHLYCLLLFFSVSVLSVKFKLNVANSFRRRFIGIGVSRVTEKNSADLTHKVSGSCRWILDTPHSSFLYPLKYPVLLFDYSAPPFSHPIHRTSSGLWLGVRSAHPPNSSLPSGVLGERWKESGAGPTVVSPVMLLLACLSVSLHLLSHTCLALEKR